MSFHCVYQGSLVLIRSFCDPRNHSFASPSPAVSHFLHQVARASTIQRLNLMVSALLAESIVLASTPHDVRLPVSPTHLLRPEHYPYHWSQRYPSTHHVSGHHISTSLCRLSMVINHLPHLTPQGLDLVVLSPCDSQQLSLHGSAGSTVVRHAFSCESKHHDFRIM